MTTSDEDVSILILSDDDALNEDIDAKALANLIYVRDIVDQKKANDPENFDPESIDIIVEIIDPKHHDIVNSYSVNNVVISNRYISKMVTQISEVDGLFEFYNDVLSYDDGCDGSYSSKEIYIKMVKRFFTQVPQKTTADVFVRTIYSQTREENPTLCIGYVKPGGNIVIFGGDLSKIQVELNEEDKVILFTSH